MTTITKAPGVGKGRPLCIHVVHLSPVNTRTKLWRISQAKAKGHPPEQCGEASHYLIDDQPYCRSHAGQIALKILQEPKDG